MLVKSGCMYLLGDICKYMCEKFCGNWGNIAAQVASEVLRIRAHIDVPCKSNSPRNLFKIKSPNGVPVAVQCLVHKLVFLHLAWDWVELSL